MHRTLASAALLTFSLVLTACGGTQTTTTGSTSLPMPEATGTRASILESTSADAIPGQYIVVLNKGALAGSDLSAQSAGSLISTLGLDPAGITVQHVYGAALHGFAAKLSVQNLQKLSADPRVAYIEQDQIVRASATQSNATWGLDRVDQRDLPLNGTYTYTPTGQGVTAYIVDTGINLGHADFGGRAARGYDAIGDGQNGNDCNGHGTHVAGTVGGSAYGVAKTVNLVAVRVLGCDGSGSNSGVIAGVNWIAQNAKKPAVANMSLGGGASSALDSAVNSAISAGVTFAVAAGNENQNACNVSPARVTNALTVAASTNTDARASFSNYGTCVDLFAPGQNITSAWIGSTSATRTISGTSMASPHVAGVAALYLQGNPTASASQVSTAILNSTTANKISGVNGSPNKLLYSLLGTTSPTPTPTEPCTGCEKYTGSLNAGGTAYQPNGTYFQTAGGTLKGWLQGPSGTDFDLSLLRWNGSSWTRVAASEGTTSTESVTYNATSGYYMWRVYAYSGSGSYTFWMQRP